MNKKSASFLNKSHTGSGLLIKRRDFLYASSFATASLMMPKFLKALETQAAVPPGNKVVVVLQLSGGNDGLNTVIPVRNDIYYRSRPGIGVQKDKSLALTDEVSLHPALISLKTLYDEGNMAILNNVGYPNPDRSHFRSMDIWHSASQSNEYWNNGWIGRYLDAQCHGCDKPTQALEIDDVLSLALKGEQNNALAVKDPRRLFGTSNEKYFREMNKSFHTGDHHDEKPVDYLYKTLAETLSSADYIFKQSRLHPSTGSYPNTELGNGLKTIASLIFSDINTKVYYISLGSFDTHVGQEAQQARLFTQLSDAVKSFTDDLKKNGRMEDVLLFTFSEFGRRVAQNASNGTDHGTANNMFLISGGLKKKGLLNPMPDLEDLNQGDLKYNVDFKNVYATVLEKWLAADSGKILKAHYDTMDFI
ncbi:twin-arginine translocation pathway signal [Niabella ginsenosidivorans]|uniref:Twin-arginine translocation pathway signal n=1 Tax=Niabella ginsenosidivorans TaxID=1176587 RepID=A0A1A9I5J1_9BACT|nr:DUF1501 domain-containing protein [Niabella ginsenosidivorans]ANH82938.1 twin-arginine translocation pathway signal [Niabella ginsenosidivorans]